MQKTFLPRAHSLALPESNDRPPVPLKSPADCVIQWDSAARRECQCPPTLQTPLHEGWLSRQVKQYTA
jgi:hypothetical protein